MPDDDCKPMASRSGVSNAIGKNTEEIKARVPYEIKEGFTRIAHEMGMTESELLREMLMIKVLGVDVVRTMNEKRLRLVAGIGHE